MSTSNDGGLQTNSISKPVLWTPGDWNAFFGFGTNILVNMLVFDRPCLRFVAEDAGLAGIRPHPAGTRADDVPFDLLLRLPRLQNWRRRPAAPTSARYLPASACPHMFHRHLRDHVADHDQDRRSDEGLVRGAWSGCSSRASS